MRERAPSLDNGEIHGPLQVMGNIGRGAWADDKKVNSVLIMLIFSGPGGPYVLGIWTSEDTDLVTHNILMIDIALGTDEGH